MISRIIEMKPVEQDFADWNDITRRMTGFSLVCI